jgi:hypothetical protein
VKWLKSAKVENLEDALVIWIWQENAKNGTVTDEVSKEEVKALCQQRSVTQKLVSIFLQKLHYSKDQYCIRWYYYRSSDTYSTVLPFLLPSRS